MPSANWKNKRKQKKTKENMWKQIKTLWFFSGFPLFSFVFLIGRRHYYNSSNSRYLMGESEGVFVFLRSVKAWASFVGEITMTSYLSRWIAQLEFLEKSEKWSLLCVSPCISRTAIRVETSLVAHANAMLIPSAAMSTDLCFAPAFLYRSVTSYHMW